MFYFQDLSLNAHSSLDLHGSSSSFDNHWWNQRYDELLGWTSASFIWCIKACMNLNGTRVTCWKWLKKLWKGSKNDRKNPVEKQHFYKCYKLQYFLKDSLHKKAIKNKPSRTFLKTNSEICIFCIFHISLSVYLFL